MDEMDVLIEQWIKSTYLFVKDCIGIEPDEQQKRFLDTVDYLVLKKERARAGDRTPIGIQIDSGKGCGKTSALSWVIMKWLVIYEGCKILCTAPKQDLLRDNLWGEFAKWIRYGEEHGNGILTDYLGIQADKVFNAMDERNTVCLARVASRSATVADKEATLQGYHADYMMLIGDEAYGIDDDVFNPLEGTLTGRVNFMILVGNPSKNTGYVADCATKNAHKWMTLRFNGEESGLVTGSYIDSMREKYAGNENGYRMNVLGLKPLDEDGSVFRFDQIQKCMGLYMEPERYESEPVILGVDIGMGGDDSAVAVRQGDYVHGVYTRRCLDTDENIDFIEYYIRLYSPRKVIIDKNGVGRGVYDNMSKAYPLMIEGCMSGGGTTDKQYANKRAELMMLLADRVNKGSIRLPDDDELRNELSVVKLVKDSQYITLESKANMRKRGIASPNKADALSYSLMIDDKHAKQTGRYGDYAYTGGSRYGGSSSEYSWMVA